MYIVTEKVKKDNMSIVKEGCQEINIITGQDCDFVVDFHIMAPSFTKQKFRQSHYFLHCHSLHLKKGEPQNKTNNKYALTIWILAFSIHHLIIAGFV